MENPGARSADGERWTTGTYAELRRLAAGVLAGERRGHTLAPTELVHEAWLKLRGAPPPADASRVALAARAMREALVDHARRRSAQKRGEGRAPVALDAVALDSVTLAHVTLAPVALDDGATALERDAYVVALDGALDELAAFDAELARVVELRFFAGLDNEAVAAALGLSPRTVKRRWQLAKAWLHRRVGRA